MRRNLRNVPLLAVLLCALPLLTHCNCGNPEPDVGIRDGSTVTEPGDAGETADAGQTEDGGETDAGTGVTVVSVELSPSAPMIAQGTLLPMSATAVLSDGTVRDVTEGAEWSSSAPAIATVSNSAGTRGHVQGVSAGTAEITATVGGVSGVATVTVSTAALSSIEVSPSTATLAAGTQQPFAAVGTFSDGTTQDLTEQATWSSSASAVLTVSDAAGSKGLAQAVAAGSATVSAQVLGQTGTAAVTVTPATLSTLAISPATASIPDGTTQQFTATGTFSDGTSQDLTEQVTWTSSDTAVATISDVTGSKGFATAGGVGTATITASFGSTTATADLTVTAATLQSIAITPSMATLPVGAQQQFVATGTYSDSTTKDITTQVVWSSSNAAVVTVSNTQGSQGLATAKAAGTANVSATLSNVTAAAAVTVTSATLTTIAVTPVNPTIPDGSTQQFAATGTYSDMSTADLTQQVTWSSSNTAVATISNATGSKGLASAQSVGQTTITATFGTTSGGTTLSVSPATVASITVTPANASIAVGTKQQYTATANLSDGTTQDVTQFANWASSDTGVATISNALGSKGEATAVAAGTTTISATYNGVTGSTGLTVVNATLVSIAVTPANPKLPVNFQLQFTATGTYSNGSTQDLTTQVTWASSNTGVASISNAFGSEGRASAISAGTTDISATMGSVSGQTTLTVTNATLTSISVTPNPLTLQSGQSQQMTATGTFSDGSMVNVTRQATWSSSAPTVLSVSNAPGSKGMAFGVRSGSATVSATLNAVTGTAAATVN